MNSKHRFAALARHGSTATAAAAAVAIDTEDAGRPGPLLERPRAEGLQAQATRVATP
jgi:hypothetical protein